MDIAGHAITGLGAPHIIINRRYNSFGHLRIRIRHSTLGQAVNQFWLFYGSVVLVSIYKLLIVAVRQVS
jgi:hypothetical protein